MSAIKLDQSGFSAVELLITLIIGSVFVIAFYQVYVVITQGNAAAKSQAAASDVSYSYLRRYTTRPSFSCNSTTDLTSNASAPGQVLLTETVPDSFKLPKPATAVIKVYAPRGCDTAFPVEIEVAVTYGSPEKKIIHASYVN